MRETIHMPPGAVMGSELILPEQRNWGDYQRFLAAKRFTPQVSGLTEVPPLNPAMFPHQRDVTAWALRLGPGRRISRNRNRKESDRAGLGSVRLRAYRRPSAAPGPASCGLSDGYERARSSVSRRSIARFRTRPETSISWSPTMSGWNTSMPPNYSGVVLDESSILKSFRRRHPAGAY